MKTKKTEKFYITTPIYYVNDRPHLGHAYTTLMADVLARYFRKKLGNDSVFFLTGTDEHGSKVEKSALSNKLSPQEFSDKIVQEYKEVWQQLAISNDEFFRTTDPEHIKNVQSFLQNLYEKGHIYKGKYKGLYCIGCEKFLSFEETNNGACIYHPNIQLVEQEEENYFFNLNKFSHQVLEKIENKEYTILPKERLNEIVGKIKLGINDISISRSGVRWGIPIPWDPQHTVYVWVDALINYYSAVKIFPKKEKFWPPDLHLMAKDILWFHALIWEGLLLASNLSLPKTILAHGFFTIDGQKMSKSLGNVLDPRSLVAEYGLDGTRYLLITSFVFGYDGDVSLSKFKDKYNSDLANGLGNLIARVAKLCERLESENTLNLLPVMITPQVADYLEQYRPDEALKYIWLEISRLDQDIALKKPWNLSLVELEKVLLEYIEKIIIIANDLEVFLPNTSKKIINIFTQKKIKKPESLFERKP